MTVDAEDAMQALAGAWVDHVASKVRPDACILAARVGHEALSYFRVAHDVRPVAVACFNAEAMIELAAGRDVAADWPPEAWSVSASSRSEDRGPLPGWSGHLVLTVGDFLVDLTAEQFDRPSKGIVTGGPVLAHRDELEDTTMLGPEAVSIALTRGQYVAWGEPENLSYRRAPDWRRNYGRFAGPVIRAMRAELEGARA